MCLVVIQDHFGTNNETSAQRFLDFFDSLAVPCFMFLSFFLIEKDLQLLKKERIKARLCRLYIPIFFWNFIYFVYFNLMSVALGKADLSINYKGLILGLIFSHYDKLTPHLWFLTAQIIDLVFIVIIFQFIEKKEYRIVTLLTIMTITFVLEYIGIAFYLFETAPYETRYPLGRAIECIPYAVGGIIYSWCIHNQSFVKIKIPIWVLCVFFSVVSRKNIPEISGFGYNGLYLMLCATSICLFVLNLPDVFNGRMKIIINSLGSCTMGIYCLHMLIGKTLNILLPNKLFQGTLLFDMLILILGILGTIVIRIVSKSIDQKWLSYVI